MHDSYAQRQSGGVDQGSFENNVQDWMSDGFASGWPSASDTNRFPGMPAPPVQIPSKPPSIQEAPTGGSPMGTPPSARGFAAQLPFVDGSPDGMFGTSEPSRTSFSHASDSSLPSDASGFARYTKRHVQHEQSRQAPLAASDSFEGFGQRASTRSASAGLGFGTAHEGMFASEMAKEQLQADAQQRRLERRVSLGAETEEAVPTLQVNLGDIPGRLVDMGRPPLPAGAKALAAAASRQEPPPLPKDSTVMEHGVAGDLVLGKMNKSMKKSMARMKSRRKSDGSAKSRKSMANSDLQFNVDDEDAHPVKWYKNFKFWTAVASILITELLLISAIIMLVRFKHYKVIWFEWWRWLFFLSGFMPIYWFSRAVIHLLVLMVETTAFTTRKAVYYTVGTRKPLRRFLRVALLIPLFVGCFYTNDNENTHVKNVFRTLARLLGCLLLFFFANVLKTLVAKIMASHFHKEAHFEKMQEALLKEYFLITLSQPRTEVESSSSDEEGEVEADQQLEELDSPAARMYRKSMVFQQDQKKIREEVTKHKRSAFSIPHFLHRRHRNLHRHHSSSGLSGESTSTFERVASQEAPFPPVPETDSCPPDPVANGHQFVSADARRTSAESQRQSPPTIHRRQQPPGQKPLAANTSFKSQRFAQGNSNSSPGTKSFRRSASKTHGSAQASQDDRTSVMSKMKRSMTILAGRPISESGMTDRSNRSVVKSHLDAIPEDRKAIEKGGGNAVQKLHEVEKYIRKNKLKVTFADTLGAAKHQEDSEVTSKNEAKKLAFYLFWNIKPSFNRTYILPEDLEHFLEPGKAQQAFDILDVDGDGQVTLHNIRDAVVNVYQERKHLAFTLKDTKTIVGKLERIAAFVIHVLMAFFYLVIFNVDVTHLWTAVAAAIVAFSFIFKSAIATMFDSVIFLFVVHAFDVGDGILINGDLHKVEEIALNMTVLKRWDGCRIWYPNSLMNVVPILNITRSENKWEFFKVFLDVGVPSSVYDTMRSEVMKFLEDNPKSYTGKGQVINCSAGDPMKVQLGFFFEYAHCGVDMAKIGDDRHRLFCKIADVLCAHRVQYTFPGFNSFQRPLGAAENGSLPPRHPGPSGPPSPTLPTHHSSPGSGWATLRQRTGLGGSPDPHRASLTQSGASPSRPGPSESQSGGVQGFLQAAGGGLQRGFGSNVSLPTLDERGGGALQQELRNQERNEQDMVKIHQMALKRGTSSSGTGGSALPSAIQPLMQQPKS
ncbi:hypothetical protein WJX77_004930 [Trebouxia sp. C0004]